MLDPSLLRALRAYVALRRRLGAQGAPPPLGYRRAYLALVDARHRARLAAILDDAFPAAHPDDDAAALARTRALVEWITAPLDAARWDVEPEPLSEAR
jgi:hypothetical protein